MALARYQRQNARKSQPDEQERLREALQPFAEAWQSEWRRWKAAEDEGGEDGDTSVVERWADAGLEFSQTGLTWANLRAADHALVSEPSENQEGA